METQRPPEALVLSRRAREHVRARWRSTAYYQAGDGFSELFLGVPFQVEPELARTVGTDYSALDCLYEALGSGDARALGALEAVTDALQALTDLPAATAALPSLQEALRPPTCALLDVCRALVATVTVRGATALVSRGAASLVPRWLALWAGALQVQNRQQAHLNQLTGAMRAPPGLQAGAWEALTVRATDFDAGVREYLERFSETGASTVAFVGGLPFMDALSRPGLEALLHLLEHAPEFLGRVSQLLRLARTCGSIPPSRSTRACSAPRPSTACPRAHWTRPGCPRRSSTPGCGGYGTFTRPRPGACSRPGWRARARRHSRPRSDAS